MTPMNLTRSITSGYIFYELDWRRFRKLSTVYLSCPRPASCNDLYEFIAVTNALENVDANIWLIDMTEQEMRQRISQQYDSFREIEYWPLKISLCC